MKLANRIFVNLIGIVVFSSLLAALVGAILISRALKSEAFSRVANDLKSARLFLDDRIEELVIYSQLRAQGTEGGIIMENAPDLSMLIEKDLDTSASVLWRFLSEKSEISLEKPANGFVVFPVQLLENIGFDIAWLKEKTLCEMDRTLWLFSLYPGKLGTAFSAILLNGNEELVTDLQEVLFGTSLYGKKPFGTVTIFCGDTRIATTVLGPGGEVAFGTKVSAVVRKKVLEQGGVWLDRAFVVDDYYLSAYEPIKDPGGENIGILYVGVLEQKYLDVQNRALAILSGITLPTLGLLIFGVFLISKWIVKPISALAEASERVAGGEFDTKVRHQGKTIEFRTLLHSFNTMISAIKNREDMLVQKNSQLEDANRDYQELLSFVTHELNNSIGSLLLNVMMLSDGTVGVLQAEQDEVVQQILRDVERFRDMVRNYLNISRLEKGTLKFRPESVDLKKVVVLPVISRLKSRIEHRQMRVDWEWKDEAVLSVDTELMDICYSNLVINALKYGKEWIRLSARKHEGWWILEVANGGTPIPGEKIPLLFKKFSRLVKSDDGAGLGLYLIRKIIERHGGEVWCESLENGTSFDMKIPSSIVDARAVQSL